MTWSAWPWGTPSYWSPYLNMAWLFSRALEILIHQYCLIQGKHLWPHSWSLWSCELSLLPHHIFEANRYHDPQGSYLLTVCSSLITFLLIRLRGLMPWWFTDRIQEKKRPGWPCSISAWLLEEPQRLPPDSGLLWYPPNIWATVLSTSTAVSEVTPSFIETVYVHCVAPLYSFTFGESVHDMDKYFLSRLLRGIIDGSQLGFLLCVYKVTAHSAGYSYSSSDPPFLLSVGA